MIRVQTYLQYAKGFSLDFIQKNPDVPLLLAIFYSYKFSFGMLVHEAKPLFEGFTQCYKGRNIFEYDHESMLGEKCHCYFTFRDDKMMIQCVDGTYETSYKEYDHPKTLDDFIHICINNDIFLYWTKDVQMEYFYHDLLQKANL